MKPTIQIELTFIPYENGGRVQLPSGTGYAPHLVIKGDDEYLGIRFIDYPKDTAFNVPNTVTAELIYHPQLNYSSLSPGTEIELKEGGRTVANGKVIQGIST